MRTNWRDSRDVGDQKPLHSNRVNFHNHFRVGVWQNRYFCKFMFLSRRISSRILSPDFSPQFCRERCQEKSSSEIFQNLYNKNPRHISAEGPGQLIAISVCISDPKSRTFSKIPVSLRFPRVGKSLRLRFEILVCTALWSMTFEA